MLNNNTLVQVRGASGSGKSTLVRNFLKGLPKPARYFDKAAWDLGHVESATSRPFALSYPLPRGGRRLIVPGHYDAPGGGCDMIKKADHAYDIAERGLFYGAVLMEGLFLSKEYARLLARRAAWAQPPVVIYLDLPEDVCEESVQQRRESLGRARRLLSKHSSDWREVGRAVQRLRDQGVKVEDHTRDSAAERLKELFL